MSERIPAKSASIRTSRADRPSGTPLGCSWEPLPRHRRVLRHFVGVPNGTSPGWLAHCIMGSITAALPGTWHAAYARGGKPGAVRLRSLPSGGYPQQPSAFTREQDLVWRIVGRPSVVLISEGPTSCAPLSTRVHAS